MNNSRRLLAIGILTVATTSHTALAQPRGVRRFSAVAVSPDGQHLAWAGPIGSPQGGRAIMLGARDGSGAKIVELPGVDSLTATEIAWSPDGAQLVVRGASSGSPALWLVPANGAAGKRVAVMQGDAHGARVSPDGSQIAALYSSPQEFAGGPTVAAQRDTGVIGAQVDRQHLAIVNVATGALRVIGPVDLFVHEFDWSPDSRHLVVSAATGSGNNNWYVSRLSSMDAASGAVRELARPKTQIAQPTWSPDGTRIAYICGLMSDESVTGGDLCIVPAAGGAERDITPGIKTSIGSFAWRGASSILAVSIAKGGVQLSTVDASSGTLTPTWSGDAWVSAGTGGGFPPRVSASRDGGWVAAIRESPDTPPELWAGASPSQWTQITHANEGLHAGHGRVTSLHWKSDAFDVQGYLMYPVNFDSTKRYPMIVSVHGGPAAAHRPLFRALTADDALLSNAGYFVLEANPRGSHGQGQAFVRANVRDFGYGDFRDIMKGVDAVIAKYPVDPQRLGLTGWSYGGYMTMWGVTQTKRFKAAVAGAGIANWLSYAGENGINEWTVPYFGTTVYDNPAVYARSAPITFIAHARTPTLIVVGERDTECPAPQSFEFWRGLQHAGATAELIVYPDEGHGLSKPEHVRDLRARTVAWFDKYLKAPIS